MADTSAAGKNGPEAVSEEAAKSFATLDINSSLTDTNVGECVSEIPDHIGTPTAYTEEEIAVPVAESSANASGATEVHPAHHVYSRQPSEVELENAQQLVEAVDLLFGGGQEETCDDGDNDSVCAAAVGASASAHAAPPGFFHQESATFQDDLDELLHSADTEGPEDVSFVDDLDSEECARLQQEEAEVLQAILGDGLTFCSDDRRSLRAQLYLNRDGENIEYGAILFFIPEEYPGCVPIFELEVSKTKYLAMTDADYIYDQVLATAVSHVGTVMIYDLIWRATFLVESVAELRSVRESEQATAWAKAADEKKWQQRLILPWQMQSCELAEPATAKEETVGADEFEASTALLVHEGSTAMGGLPAKCPAVSCDMYNPAHFVGPMKDILAAMPNHLRILKVENILKDDLARRFESCWNKMRTAYWHSVRRKIDNFQCEPVMAFHGTNERNLPNIVKQGLVVPGTKPGVTVQHGSYLGVGIYTSPSIELSLGYSSRLRVIVCAVLLGHSYHLGTQSKKKSDVQSHRGRADSVISPDGFQYVVPCADQVLPCYVIDLVEKRTKDELSNTGRAPLPVKTITARTPLIEESSAAKKARLKARALKFLPFGFGPAGKKAMTIEAAASYDEDEEREYTQWNGADDEHDSGSVQVVRSELQQYRYMDE
ncbi:uncharacterized protein LOC135808369 [Sycon ciliatum]|uniref:uncharacterized protein LOC135808369 n=1 Tax=Sycon ciliatum TaxID=27933 RepID=UPI0031F6A3FC